MPTNTRLETKRANSAMHTDVDFAPTADHPNR